jgi:ubiquinone/menaquinone biosynthesis C-methylase UbiE
MSGPDGGTPSWRDLEQAGWQLRAVAYDRFFGPMSLRIADTVLDAAGAGPGTRLLDACCGPGYLAGRAVARGCAVTGIDIAAAMVDLAAARYPKASFRVGDVEELPFGDAGFDAVVCNIGIHHVTDPGRCLAGFRRVLAGAGRLAMTVWDESRSLVSMPKDAVLAVVPFSQPGLPDPPPRPDYASPAAVGALLQRAGFGLESMTPVTFEQRFASPQALWDDWLPTAIRTAPLLEAQPPEVRQAARRAFDDMVAGHIRPDGSVLLPASMNLIVAAAG